MQGRGQRPKKKKKRLRVSHPRPDNSQHIAFGIAMDALWHGEAMVDWPVNAMVSFLENMLKFDISVPIK